MANVSLVSQVGNLSFHKRVNKWSGMLHHFQALAVFSSFSFDTDNRPIFEQTLKKGKKYILFCEMNSNHSNREKAILVQALSYRWISVVQLLKSVNIRVGGGRVGGGGS